MKWKQRLKKVLRSAMIFAMVLTLCGTTLAKAYASYAAIIIQHVWVEDSAPKQPERATTESPAPTESEPASTEPPAPTQSEPASTESAAPTESGSENPEPSAAPSGRPEDVTVTVDLNNSKNNVTMNGAETIWAPDPASSAADSEDENENAEEQNPQEESQEHGTDAQAVAEVVAESVSSRLEECAGYALTRVQAASVQKLVAQALTAAVEDADNSDEDGEEDLDTDDSDNNEDDEEDPDTDNSDEDADSEDKEPATWTSGREEINPYNITTMITASLSEDSAKDLAARGYKTTVEVQIRITGGSVYVSADNGENWTYTDANGVTQSCKFDEIAKSAGSGDMVYTFTFTHTLSASTSKPEGPKDPDPVDPKDPDPVIPDPNVPLAEPETPEEPEILDPDVPLADIPETGDVSVLWYGAAAALTAALAVLLYQERRSKKTA